jgi:hypothetical protein
MPGTPLEGASTNPAVPGLKGTNTATSGIGVLGESQQWTGVQGVSHGGAAGTFGFNDGPPNATGAGVWGESKNWDGVHGVAHAQGVSGVAGLNDNPSNAAGGFPGAGVFGLSTNSVGVWGESPNWEGVHAVAHGKGAAVFAFNDGPESATAAGVFGSSKNFIGVWGESQSANQPGVFGKSTKWQGVHGESTDQVGVIGASQNFVGVWGETHSANQVGIFGKGPRLAGRFEGDVEVTGDIRLTNADCAEDFSIGDATLVEPGTVMVLNGDGALLESSTAYDKRVAGVVSGAGGYRPGLILDRQPGQQRRVPVALLGKVYCKVDAGYGSIDVGDLLTTSSTPGHAMKADDPVKAFGTVIGKALTQFTGGTGLIPILITLQ